MKTMTTKIMNNFKSILFIIAIFLASSKSYAYTGLYFDSWIDFIDYTLNVEAIEESGDSEIRSEDQYITEEKASREGAGGKWAEALNSKKLTFSSNISSLGYSFKLRLFS